jgi:hypothetical protein
MRATPCPPVATETLAANRRQANRICKSTIRPAVVGAPACPYLPGTQLLPKQALLPGSKKNTSPNSAALTRCPAPAWAHDNGERAHVCNKTKRKPPNCAIRTRCHAPAWAHDTGRLRTFPPMSEPRCNASIESATCSPESAEAKFSQLW